LSRCVTDFPSDLHWGFYVAVFQALFLKKSRKKGLGKGAEATYPPLWLRATLFGCSPFQVGVALSSWRSSGFRGAASRRKRGPTPGQRLPRGRWGDAESWPTDGSKWSRWRTSLRRRGAWRFASTDETPPRCYPQGGSSLYARTGMRLRLPAARRGRERGPS